MSTKNSDVPEKERELINKVAQWIVNQGFEGPAVMLIQTIKPLSTIGGELAFFYLAPFLPFLEEKGYDFLDTFEKRENLERLIRRIERLHKEKSKEEEKTKGPSLWSRFKKKLFPSRVRA